MHEILLVQDSGSLDDVLENKRINDWLTGLAPHPKRQNLPHGADAEIVDIDNPYNFLAISTDTIGEEIEAGLYSDPYAIGWVTVMANFSDLAAVGATPLGFLLSVSWPKHASISYIAGVRDGISDACRECQTYVIGGDTNSSRELSLTGCAVGLVPKERLVTRTGMQPGDIIYLTHPAGAGNLSAARF